MVLVLELLLDHLHVWDGLELVAVLKMLLLDPQQVPNASPYDFDGSGHEGEELGVAEVKGDAGRNGHHPRKTHNEVGHNDDVVIALGFEGEILAEQPVLGVGLQQPPIVLQIPEIRVNGGDGRRHDPDAQKVRIPQLVNIGQD